MNVEVIKEKFKKVNKEFAELCIIIDGKHFTMGEKVKDKHYDESISLLEMLDKEDEELKK